MFKFSSCWWKLRSSLLLAAITVVLLPNNNKYIATTIFVQAEQQRTMIRGASNHHDDESHIIKNNNNNNNNHKPRRDLMMYSITKKTNDNANDRHHDAIFDDSIFWEYNLNEIASSILSPSPSPPTLAPVMIATPNPTTTVPESTTSPTAGIVIDTPSPTTTNGTELASSSPTSTTPAPTAGGGDGTGTTPMLRQILDAGTLKCGVPVDRKGFAMINNSTGRMEGFDADLCRAVAAAIFNTSANHVEFVPLTASQRFLTLASGGVDILARTTTHTMQRHIMEPTSREGFSFSIPYLYNGLQFGGSPQFVECANNFSTIGPTCVDTSICVIADTTILDNILSQNANMTTVVVNSQQQQYQYLIDGLCNVIAGEQFDIAESVVRTFGYTGDYALSAGIHSKEPLSVVTRNNDIQFSDFVNWVIVSLLSAEEFEVTSQTTSPLGTTDIFGPEFANMFANVIQDVGNYAEIYERNLAPILPRSIPNQINDGSTGLRYALPLGVLSSMGDGPVPGGTLETILSRGFLKCGVTERSFFGRFDPETQQWSGYDVDFCRAVAAAIFGDPKMVEFTDVSTTERFINLQNGDVDILSRITTVTLIRDVNEPTTGTGFSFSRPSFYDGLTFGGVPDFQKCAANFDPFTDECFDLSICVVNGTTYETRLRQIFPNRVVQITSNVTMMYQGLVTGECNVIAGGVADVSRTRAAVSEYNGPYALDPGRYSKDPLALVTREDDVQFSNFVFWVVSIIFASEEQNIFQADAFSKLPEVNLFGPTFSSMFRNAVSAVGNYAEIYNRNAEEAVPRGGPNLRNPQLSGPQHYPLPGLARVFLFFCCEV